MQGERESRLDRSGEERQSREVGKVMASPSLETRLVWGEEERREWWADMRLSSLSVMVDTTISTDRHG